MPSSDEIWDQAVAETNETLVVKLRAQLRASEEAREALQVFIGRLTDALDQYGVHLAACAEDGSLDSGPCDCGLDAALTAPDPAGEGT